MYHPACGGGQAEACGLGVAGLQAIHAVIAKQGVLVVAAEAAVRERALRGDRQDLRMIVQQARGQHRHVARAGRMVRRGDAGDAGEPGAAQAELARVPVHALQERRLRSVQVARDRQRRVIAGDDHQAFQQARERDRFAGHQAHARFIVGDRMHVVGGDGDFVLPRAPALLDTLVSRVGGHQLGQRGRLPGDVRVVLVNHCEGCRIEGDGRQRCTRRSRRRHGNDDDSGGPGG